MNLAVVFLGIVYVWRRFSRGRGYIFRQLLPGGKEVTRLIVILTLLYIGAIFVFRPEVLPRSIGAHWILRGVLSLGRALQMGLAEKAAGPKSVWCEIDDHLDKIDFERFNCFYT